MTENNYPVPRQLILHKKSRTLEIEFETGERFVLPCEYLRLASPSADKQVQGKAAVNILAIEPVGNYAIKPVFSDGHQTGIYSWATLYQLGVAYTQKMEKP